MEIRPHRTINRKKTKVIKVGNIFIGGDHPISVQSMTNTLTHETKATIQQVNSLEEKGADIVRVSCPDEESTLALKTIMAGINQTLMLSLSMAVIAALIGAGGLGLTVYVALGRLDIGSAFVGGIGIVLIAIIFDRITQKLINT